MKIRDMRSDNLCNFKDIFEGECFVYNNFIYMKVLRSCDDQSNAVLLITGELRPFDGKENVIPIETELIIK